MHAFDLERRGCVGVAVLVVDQGQVAHAHLGEVAKHKELNAVEYTMNAHMRNGTE